MEEVDIQRNNIFEGYLQEVINKKRFNREEYFTQIQRATNESIFSNLDDFINQYREWRVEQLGYSSLNDYIESKKSQYIEINKDDTHNKTAIVLFLTEIDTEGVITKEEFTKKLNEVN